MNSTSVAENDADVDRMM